MSIISWGPLTVSWGVQQTNQSKNQSNLSTTNAAALVLAGTVLGAAGTHFAPIVYPHVKTAVTNGTDKTVAFVNSYFKKSTVANNSNPTVVANNSNPTVVASNSNSSAETKPAPSRKYWFFS